ncbi:similar to Saccharomyces cerevisiae YEL044W IES6 Protein that associates with the INO80 chromatin remodeling complex under low-salt conditions [Maudiozyma barnettii]|uniref:Similar to Saccharomyces cerevisiae YEL044W IES6 Protein that associates with the INO80 chromatin remodeling complex under low-salt conditions n=1 Tax=Maudiozyma barnettii TaxID=61262 RepID=A0A8H2VB93_9SACH|nr:Ies6p [Kazachstania barnettii]CAB4252098.1 similar to Saccharomyces cerevisiae YEL044W IES6 Protein that associates with the INO80 chromatin remodeling complex under low-salt conditions [Kazachstania barnettii]CAD1778613.1 similar to Saccharomyces cerevisiae YEL044W IES6 Protein that associates with the INO80 chromatin remodeling complex under low-salt conditions [Kazachstania barnettii]
MAPPPPPPNKNNDLRLEFLRTIAQKNILAKPLKKLQIEQAQSGQPQKAQKKSYRRHKGARQLISEETKRINAILEQQQQLYDEDNSHVRKTPKVTFFNLSAPPSIKPTKHYCDITGLNGPYKSPTNNIRYHNSEIYQFIVKPMAPGVDQEYLKLRGANFVLK